MVSRTRKTIILDISGYKHNIRIFGTNPSNPVIISLHGGPGGCDRYFMRNMQKYFVGFNVVCWDQLGSGCSYRCNILKEDMNITHFVRDLDMVVNYIRNYFNRDKLILMAHSWGTIVGSIYACEHSNKISLFISCGHLINARIAEEISYSNLTNIIDNPKDLKTLRKIGKPINGLYNSTNDRIKKMRLNQKYKGSIYQITSENRRMVGIDVGILTEYSFINIIRYIKGIHFSWNCLKDELMNIDVTDYMRRMTVPTYLFAGRHDNVTPQEPVLQCLQNICNDNIRYHVIEGASHSPQFEKPIEFVNEIIRIVKEGGNI